MLEFRLGYAGLLFVIVVCCKVKVSATDRPTGCVVCSECDLETSALRRSIPTSTVDPWRGRGASDMFNIQNSLKRNDTLLSLLFKFALYDYYDRRMVKEHTEGLKLLGHTSLWSALIMFT